MPSIAQLDQAGSVSSRNIPKEVITELSEAPAPHTGYLLQTRIGKAKKNALGQGAVYDSAIFKNEHDGPIFVSETGLIGDEHVYHSHGGFERAVHQYNAAHYADWRAEYPPRSDLYEPGAYGENLCTLGMDETTVCIGDTFQVGSEVLLQITEPRHPCYKLNSRFQWPRALKRTLRTGRHGWNYRVLRTGHVCKGDNFTLVDRTHPKWSIMNVERVIRAKSVPLSLLAECTTLPMTDLWLDLAKKRVRGAPKRYTLTDAQYVSPRVRHLTFTLKEDIVLPDAHFDPYAFAQIRFGPDLSIERSYSIVGGDLRQFQLGVALDDHSRGGSAYIHHNLKVGDEIEMAPGANPKAIADDEKCREEGINAKRIVIIGGIGVTAFLPSVREWEANHIPYEVHYAVRSPEEAAFLASFPKDKMTIYAKSQGKRLDINNVIPPLNANGSCAVRIFSCGPSRLMQAEKERCAELGYPEHMIHFEDFGGDGNGELGPEFEVEVDEPDTKRHETFTVPSNKSLLDVLNDAGFDVLYSCKSGGCGACKVTLCNGKVEFKSEVLTEKEKQCSLQSCVDRGVGKIRIEID